jgi:hypothetical protein
MWPISVSNCLAPRLDHGCLILLGSFNLRTAIIGEPGRENRGRSGIVSVVEHDLLGTNFGIER